MWINNAAVYMYIEVSLRRNQACQQLSLHLAILLYVSDNSMVMLTCSVVDVGGGEHGGLTVSQ